MSVNKFNAEGYYDPTAYEALTLIEKAAKKKRVFRPFVYICSPLAGNVRENQENARRYCRFAVDRGSIPIAPHIYFTQFMRDDNPEERNLAMFMGMILLTKCAEVWVFGDVISAGMRQEIEKARRKNIPIRCFSSQLEEVKT
ncbi:MAG: DUF4406 domain-containing protein [Clostridia bacterium]|nr:DUF4406 domain-containing protein [Clostridia bacterium]